MRTNIKSARLFLVCFISLANLTLLAAEARWTPERASAWYEKQPWLAGCNFSPSTAINQLEMWQAETFDLPTIDRELGWAESLGFNCARVFLHDIPWQQDSRGYLSRIDQFLAAADKHQIKIMFVIFDSCWEPFPKPGQQRAPKPHVHNSGWVQSPGLPILTKPERYDELAPYVKGVIQRFKNDSRVLAWDLFNEPDNHNDPAYMQYEPANKAELALALLKKVFAWTREVNPDQPLTTGVWAGEWGDPAKLSPVNRFMLENSDVISFHNYGPLPEMRQRVQSLRQYKRPLLCSEYMARPAGSTFGAVMPYMKQEKVAAMNWGFVAGKTQTIYPWDSWKKDPVQWDASYGSEPHLWFHDIFRKDGSPYDPKEVLFIKKLTGKTTAWKNGALEYWSAGVWSASPFQHSNVPTFHYSITPYL